MNDAPILRLDNVRKRYGRRTVLDGVSFAIAPGRVVALLGGNGAGKTTTLKCILGVTSFEGAVEVGGLRVDKRGRDARRLIGYVPQLPALSEDDTCEQALSFTAELRGAPLSGIGDALERVNLTAQRTMRIGELSGGMRQRLALGAALLGDPKLLLLDEPTASLDLESRAQFDRIIGDLRSEGRTILLSTHHHSRLDELVDQVLILHEGALTFDGTTRELLDRFHLNRYLVNLNGNAPGDFRRALAGVGIGDERIGQAPVPWDELLQSINAKKGGES